MNPSRAVAKFIVPLSLLLILGSARADEPVLHRCEAECFEISGGEAYSLGPTIAASMRSQAEAYAHMNTQCMSDRYVTREALRVTKVRAWSTDSEMRIGTRWNWSYSRHRWIMTSDSGSEVEYERATSRNSCRRISLYDLPPVTEIGGRPVGG